MSRSNVFRRDGADVHSDATITLSQAVLGGTKRIPGIYEDILINVSHWFKTGFFDVSRLLDSGEVME